MTRHDSDISSPKGMTGEPLAILCGPPMHIGHFLRLAGSITDAVARLHAQNLSHLSLTPHTIRIDAAGHSAWVAAPPTSAPSPGAAHPEQALLTHPEPAYISPEQTGRLHRAADHRSDLYSLGAIFYQLLTGEPPFQARGLLELVHSHLARAPRPMADLRTETPPVLAEIVMKLLAKNPEERYQTAAALKEDLNTCLKAWESTAEIPRFDLAQGDISDRLLFPHKLYDREQESRTLRGAFDRVLQTGQAELFMVAGCPGIGKTTLVQVLNQPVVAAGGFFVSGKEDRYRPGTPYASIAEAFRELTRQILTDTEQRIARWQGELLQALGSNAQLMVELIPELAVVIGLQPAVPELPPAQSQSRFMLIFGKLVQVFATKERPLVVFLDDLQAADVSTLQLITYLVTRGDLRYLLLIGAYRDSEVTATHPLALSLDDLRRTQGVLESVTLAPLPLEDLGQLLADILHCDTSRVQSLAAVVRQKTAGNPFFIFQFMKALQNEHLVYLDRNLRQWQWDLEGVRGHRHADNVVDLLVAKLQRLPAAPLEQLKLAACIGDRFDLTTLALVSRMPAMEVLEAIQQAELEGVVLRVNGEFRFLHDRILEALYVLTPLSQRIRLHGEIGRRLREELSADQVQERLFELVTHLNLAAQLIQDPEERMELARLNLAAAAKAKGSAAYPSALGYLKNASRQLGARAWQHHYRLNFTLLLEMAQCLFLNGDLNRAERLFPTLLSRAQTSLETAAVLRVIIDLQTAKGEDAQAISSALGYLHDFGIHIPPHPTWTEVEQAFREVWERVGNRSIEELIDSPLMADPEREAALDILVRLYAPAYHLDNNLFYLHLCRGVDLSLRFGTSAAATHFYGWFGVILNGVFDRSQEGYRFAKLAFDLMERHRFTAYRAKALFVLRILSYWSQPIERMLQYSRAAFQAAVECGDVIIACYSSNHTCMGLIIRGDHLAQVQHEAQEGLRFVGRAGYREVGDMLIGVERFAASLRGRTRHISSYDDDNFSEAGFEAGLVSRMPTLLFYYYVVKLMARYLCEEWEGAQKAGEISRSLLWAGLSSAHSECCQLYYGLTLAARFPVLPEKSQKEALIYLAAHQKQLKVWDEACPTTFHHRWALVSAELARLEGKAIEAMQLYEEAISSCREDGFIQHEALAWELAERFYREKGFSVIADTYLNQALSCYSRWGADGKVAQLKGKYPWISARPRGVELQNGEVGRIDTITVVNACQAISGALALSDLMKTLMLMVMQNSGAGRAVLLVCHGTECLVEAQATVKETEIEVEQQVSAPLSSRLPLSMVNYVRRTQQCVILEDASEQNLFSPDEYLIRQRPVSVLCLPILKLNALVGMLYLENNLMKGAFTPDKLLVLELLAAQAVISLDNLRSADRFRGLLESAPDAMAIVDTSGKINLANAQLERLFGYRKEELLGQVIEVLIPERFHERHVQHRAGYFELPRFRPMGVDLELYGRRKDGSEFPVDISLSPFTTDEGLLVTAAIRDITERKKEEEALKQSELKYRQVSETLELRVKETVAELRQKDQMLIVQGRQASMGEMINNIAHQWRQPLNLLALLAQELKITHQHGELSREVIETNIKKTLNVLQHMSKTIDDFRDFYRPDKEKVPFRLMETVEKTLSLLEGTIKAAQIRIEIISTADPVVVGYPNEFSQALINILNNAKDAFMERKVDDPVIEIKVGSEDGKAVLAITDNAGGIPEGILDQIFHPYFTTKGPDKGTGVGLFMAKTIIEKNMNGSLSVSNVAKGARFRIEV